MQPAGVQQGCARVGEAGTGGIRKRRGSPTPLQKTLLACVFQAGERVLASPDGGADTLRRVRVQPSRRYSAGRVWPHRPRNPGSSDRRGRRPGWRVPGGGVLALSCPPGLFRGPAGNFEKYQNLDLNS